MCQKALVLIFLYLGPLSLQTTTKLRTSLRGILNCCKLQVVFQSQNKLANAFRFEDYSPKEHTSGVVYIFQCGFCNESHYGYYVRQINVKVREYIEIFLSTNRKVRSKAGAVSDNLFFLIIHHYLTVLVC